MPTQPGIPFAWRMVMEEAIVGAGYVYVYAVDGRLADDPATRVRL